MAQHQVEIKPLAGAGTEECAVVCKTKDCGYNQPAGTRAYATALKTRHESLVFTE